MKLNQPFVSIPLRFDLRKLKEEVAKIPYSAWQPHPSGFDGNSFARLISAEGGNTDSRNGRMAPTPVLENCPLLCGVLECFDTVLGSSRLMKLSVGHSVPSHVDVSPYWVRRVRVHVPIITAVGVEFHCGAEKIHMAEGESWILDNWQRHHVCNDSDSERIHLVFDTVGSPSFWNLTTQCQSGETHISVSPTSTSALRFENIPDSIVATPDEIELLTQDIEYDLRSQTHLLPEETSSWLALISEHNIAWRSLWMEYGSAESGWPHFDKALKTLKMRALCLKNDPLLSFNQFSTRKAILGRLLPTLNFPSIRKVGHVKQQGS